MLDAKVWWPLFPLLLLVVVVALTSALVLVVRREETGKGRWLQIGAFSCYLLAAVSAIASERGVVSAHLHRPFSVLTQVCLIFALVYYWKKRNRSLIRLNAIAWAGILADTALHVLVVRH
jgi:hypothetical protein